MSVCCFILSWLGISLVAGLILARAMGEMSKGDFREEWREREDD